MCTDVKCAFNIAVRSSKSFLMKITLFFHKKALKIMYFLSSVMSCKNHFFFYNMESYIVRKLMLLLQTKLDN